MDVKLIGYILGIALLCLLWKLFRKFIIMVYKMLSKTFFGAICIFAFNLIGNRIGVTIGINVITSILVAILGIPGMVSMIILKLMIK